MELSRHKVAERFFADLARRTASEAGVTRDAYGAGEAEAHAIALEVAADLGLETETDAAGNLYMTFAGADRDGPRTIIGSHLDSVPRGGNFDGAAGVVAGLSAVAGLKENGLTPRHDVTVMAIRAEEGVWFPYSYVASRMAFEKLAPELLNDLKRSDTGRSLADHIDAGGFDAGALRAGAHHLHPDSVARFIEPHIEQGPVLETSSEVVGIVTGICGNLRYRRARCLGEYGHSGTVPLKFRHDAVVATSELVIRMHARCLELQEEGADATVTFGKFATDPDYHGFSRVAGSVDFAVDVRSQSAETLSILHDYLLALIAEISERLGVSFELSDYSEAGGAGMDRDLRLALCRSAEACGVRFREMPSGAGHDAAFFAQTGIPTAMLFIRNQNGSHNPDEAMNMNDFHSAVELLVHMLAEIA